MGHTQLDLPRERNSWGAQKEHLGSGPGHTKTFQPEELQGVLFTSSISEEHHIEKQHLPSPADVSSPWDSLEVEPPSSVRSSLGVSPEERDIDLDSIYSEFQMETGGRSSPARPSHSRALVDLEAPGSRKTSPQDSLEDLIAGLERLLEAPLKPMESVYLWNSDGTLSSPYKIEKGHRSRLEPSFNAKEEPGKNLGDSEDSWEFLMDDQSSLDDSLDDILSLEDEQREA